MWNTITEIFQDPMSTNCYHEHNVSLSLTHSHLQTHMVKYNNRNLPRSNVFKLLSWTQCLSLTHSLTFTDTYVKYNNRNLPRSNVFKLLSWTQCLSLSLTHSLTCTDTFTKTYAAEYTNYAELHTVFRTAVYCLHVMALIN